MHVRSWPGVSGTFTRFVRIVIKFTHKNSTYNAIAFIAGTRDLALTDQSVGGHHTGMRLKREERETILRTIRRRDPAASVFLFGSRVRDDARGGDIDLIALSRLPLEQERHRILDDLCQELGEQKMDLVITSPALENSFVRMLIDSRKAVPL